MEAVQQQAEEQGASSTGSFTSKSSDSDQGSVDGSQYQKNDEEASQEGSFTSNDDAKVAQIMYHIIKERNHALPSEYTSYSVLPGTVKTILKDLCRSYVPPCTKCRSSTASKFRFFNNPNNKTYMLQPRYHCKNPVCMQTKPCKQPDNGNPYVRMRMKARRSGDGLDEGGSRTQTRGRKRKNNQGSDPEPYSYTASMNDVFTVFRQSNNPTAIKQHLDWIANVHADNVNIVGSTHSGSPVHQELQSENALDSHQHSAYIARVSGSPFHQALQSENTLDSHHHSAYIARVSGSPFHQALQSENALDSHQHSDYLAGVAADNCSVFVPFHSGKGSVQPGPQFDSTSANNCSLFYPFHSETGYVQPGPQFHSTSADNCSVFYPFHSGTGSVQTGPRVNSTFDYQQRLAYLPSFPVAQSHSEPVVQLQQIQNQNYAEPQSSDYIPNATDYNNSYNFIAPGSMTLQNGMTLCPQMDFLPDINQEHQTATGSIKCPTPMTSYTDMSQEHQLRTNNISNTTLTNFLPVMRQEHQLSAHTITCQRLMNFIPPMSISSNNINTKSMLNSTPDINQHHLTSNNLNNPLTMNQLFDNTNTVTNIDISQAGHVGINCTVSSSTHTIENNYINTHQFNQLDNGSATEEEDDLKAVITTFQDSYTKY